MYPSSLPDTTPFGIGLFGKPMDIGNHLIYRELVKQHTDAVNQLGSWLLYSEGDDRKMKQSAHQSCLITLLRCCLKQRLNEADSLCVHVHNNDVM